MKAASDRGLRAQPLPVAGAFHSPIMAPAAARLATALAQTPIQSPRCPVLSNVTALPHDVGPGNADMIRRSVVEQLTSPVRWAQGCGWLTQSLLAGNPGAELHELAPGKSLAGLMRRIDKSARVSGHDSPAD